MWNAISVERAVIVIAVATVLSAVQRPAAAQARPPSVPHAVPAGLGFPPSAVQVTAQTSEVGVNPDRIPCGELVERSVSSALAGDQEGAEQGLLAATRQCPTEPAAWRELAELRFSQSRWSEAESLALTAAHLAPSDTQAWLLVARSRYVLGDVMGALDAWNRTGEPRLDTTDIHGADRTRQPVVVRAAGLQPTQELTQEALGRALRRLRDLPVASGAHVTYHPVDGGLARLDVFIEERRVAPSEWRGIAAVAVRALLNSELRADVAGPLGAGELASVGWRWSTARPRVMVSLALPSPRGLPGIVSIDAMWERQSYDATPSAGGVTLVREERRRVGLHVADWSTSWLHWQTGAAFDRLRASGTRDQARSDTRNYASIDSTLDVRLAGDRLAFSATAGWWAPFGGGDRFATGGLLAAWRSSADTTVPFWSAVSEISVASPGAPLAVWQGAGTGQGRGGLLRAHPLHQRGVLTGPAFGREVAHGTLEYVRPVLRPSVGTLSVAGFVDAARAWHRLSPLNASPLYVDAGIGVRIQPAGHLGAIRIDLAHGLRGGGTRLSAAWGGRWPR
jgi:hypothetical protein